MRLSVCLSGGGVKGAAHIGALKALEEENIIIENISGTSSGSIVATLYAAGYKPDEIKEIFIEYCKKIKYIDLKNIFNVIKTLITKHKFEIKGLNSGEIIEKLINELCNKKGIKNIKEIKKNLIIASVSIKSGIVYIFKSKEDYYRYSDSITVVHNINIGKAVRASCSFPGIFCPCNFKNDILIDGGVRENIPWKELKKDNDEKILCITFNEKNKEELNPNIIDIIYGAINLMERELSIYELDGAENVLKINTKKVSLLDFNKINYLYEEGYNQTKDYLKNILVKNK